MKRLTKEEIIRVLKLEPLEPEGGFFVRTYQSSLRVQTRIGDSGQAVHRSAMTSIYYMLTQETFSAFHRLKSAEAYHFYMGASLDVSLIHPDGASEMIRLGDDLLKGEKPQLAIEPGVWQASRIAPEQSFDWALIGTTVAPGFEFDDFEIGDRDRLIHQFPQHEALIRSLTRESPE